MTLQSNRELQNTRKKLALLQQQYDAATTDSTYTPRVRNLTLKSLMRLINQLKEEIARYETRQPVARKR